MRYLLALAAVGLLALPNATQAAKPFERVRGTIESVDPDTMTVKTTEGTATVALTKDTKVTAVVRSSLDAITDGSFVGTATKGDNPPMALEVHIFPESMRGANEGFRDWDMIPDTLADGGGGGLVKSAMTNGTVKAGEVPRVKSSMTNGTVAAKTGASGDKMLTLNYGNGEKRVIAVSPRTPIVAYELADRSLLRSGAKVFVLVERDGSTLTALRAAVGKDGLTPPM